MFRIIGAVAVAMLAAGTIGTAAPTSVTGMLVEKGCYSESEGATPEQRKTMQECAIECAKGGEPVALVTEKGDVYTVIGALAANNNAKLVPHMFHTVTLTGEISEADGEKSISATDLKMVSK